jgi:hypothetical protein
MRILPSLKSEVIYARDIVKAGLDAATSAGKSSSDQPPAANLARVSQSALAPAALGAAIGLISVYLGRKGRPGTQAIVVGLVGGALGFTGGVAWGTRQQTKVCYRQAVENIQEVRDAHWLEKNPVAYA